MPITQVIFNIDKALKQKAQKKAKQQGLSYTDILHMSTKAYVEGTIEPGMVVKETFNPKTKKILDKALKNVREGKNLSPTFDNAQDAIAYLKNRHAH